MKKGNNGPLKRNQLTSKKSFGISLALDVVFSFFLLNRNSKMVAVLKFENCRVSPEIEERISIISGELGGQWEFN